MCWIFHRVEVIQIPKELVEPVDCRQELVQIAQVILAKLSRGVALRFERGGNRAGLCRQACFSTRLADCRHPCADREFTRDEVRTTRRATRLSVIVGKQHSFLCKLVEVWRPSGHHTTMVRADVPHPNVIAHDEKDVGFLVLGLGWSARAKKRSRGYEQRQAVVT